jgi:phosphoesterase RecJ-like protein
LEHLRPLFSLLTSYERANIVITTHHKPDADALGSSLGLMHFLNKIGHDAMVISPTDYGDFLKWMPGESEVVNFESNIELAKTRIAAADFIFCLDFNSLKRINDMQYPVKESKAQKVMIDHHREPEDFADYSLWKTDTSSTCELVYDFICAYKGDLYLDKDIASCLYAGIMTDTGSFRFDSVTPNTHLVAAKLIEYGVDNAKIHQEIFDSFTLNRMQFVGYCLANKLEVMPNLPVAIIQISQEELLKFDVKTGDTEGLVNFGLSIKGIELCALFVDRSVLIKISFRGRGRFPANQFSKEHFEGGGHFNAAGGQSSQSLAETVARFKQIIYHYQEYLI